MLYLYVSCITLIFFIISLIAGKRGKALSDHILIIWLFIFLVNMGVLFLIWQDGYAPGSLTEKILFEFSDASIFLHGPFFLGYTLALTKPGIAFKKEWLWHILLFAIGFSLLLYGVLSGSGVSFYLRKWLMLLKMLSLLAYAVAVIMQLKKHRRSIQDIFSNIEERKLSWLYFLTWGILIIWLISSISLLSGIMINNSTSKYINFFPNIAICIFIYLMGYFGVQQNSIFSKNNLQSFRDGNRELVSGSEELVTLKGEKYKKSGLNRTRSDKIYQELCTFMELKKPYLDPDISLFNLAALLRVLPNHLSQVINEKGHFNFYDFINGYRVKAVKEQILKGKLEALTLLGIAMDCGFNSKASFNRAFKKHTGITPTAFKSQMF